MKKWSLPGGMSNVPKSPPTVSVQLTDRVVLPVLRIRTSRLLLTVLHSDSIVSVLSGGGGTQPTNALRP